LILINGKVTVRRIPSCGDWLGSHTGVIRIFFVYHGKKQGVNDHSMSLTNRWFLSCSGCRSVCQRKNGLKKPDFGSGRRPYASGRWWTGSGLQVEKLGMTCHRASHTQHQDDD